MPNFETIQSQIEEFLETQKKGVYDIHEKYEKLPVSDSIFCAEDKVRNKFFWEAIHNAVKIQKEKKERVVVVDAGSGTGILGFFALFAGADWVYFLEQNKHSLRLSKDLARHLGLLKNTHFFHCDATKQKYIMEKFDVLVSETLSSGFVQEDFPFIIENLRQFADKEAIFLPEGFILDIEEQTENYSPLNNYSIELDTKKLEEKKNIILQHKDTRYLQFTMHAKMLNGRVFKSGTSISFLNPRRWDLEEDHPFFEIESTIDDQ